MRILLTAPFCWPGVRRGLERYTVELGRFLCGRGHQVTLFTSHPGPTEITLEDSIRVVRARQLGNPTLTRLRMGPERLFLPRVLPFLLKNRFDVIDSLFFYDACAARLAGLFKGTPYVMHCVGIPSAAYLRRLPLDNLVFRTALRGAARFILLSTFAREQARADFQREADLIPAATDLGRFPLRIGRDLDRPRILTAGDFSERRKGAACLARAFNLVKRAAPGAVLQYSGHMPREVRQELEQIIEPLYRSDVEFLGVGALEDLPRLYGEAAVTVLAAIWETQGMVLVESLACGTPVVGSRHGGIPDVVGEGVGLLFDPGRTETEATNSEGLAEAILRALELYRDRQLALRCRERAKQFSWEVLGPKIEQVLQSAAESGVARDRG